jgi:6-phosphogluconolactonase (cycloisomerase 2 family)
MRMKLNKSSQLLLVAAASLLTAGLVTACSSTLTVDFVYVTSAKAAGTYSYGEVDVFEINSESGFMRQIPTSPFSSGGRKPVAEAVSSDKTNLYVINQDDNSIVQFVIGNDGKLYPQNTVNTPGILPLAATVSGQNLFVIDTYQPLPTCSSEAPCSGSIAVFPILNAAQALALTPSQPANTLGVPVFNNNLNYWPLTLASSPKDVILPTGIHVLDSGKYLYVSAFDSTANTGYVFGFAINSDGSLAALTGSPYLAGSHPSAIASDSGSSYVYVTDQAKNQVLGFTVSSNASNAGALLALTTGPNGSNQFATGNQPSAVTVDQGANFLYVANAEDGTVSGYSIFTQQGQCNGVAIGAGGLCSVGSTATAASSTGVYATGAQPVALGIDPNMHQFLFTANYLGGSVSGFELNTDGSLLVSQSSPYAANALPTAIVAVPHNGSTK